jgi:hypothetical protein
MIPDKEELIKKLNAILHLIISVDLSGKSLAFSFYKDVSFYEIETFFRSFLIRIEGENGKIKLLKSLNLLEPRGINGKKQLFLGFPNTFPSIKEGDIARVYLFGRRGKDFIL